MSIDRFFCDGLDAATGRYANPSLGLDEVAALALAEPQDFAQLSQLQEKAWRETEQTFLPPDDVDADDLSVTGWGVIFAHDIGEDVRAALRPLLELRRAQATRVNPRFYREFSGPSACRPEESATQFLLARGAEATGPADPLSMPYYLLLVGAPHQISFRFQYELDVEYAVGRLWFSETAGYRHYAGNVVKAEADRDRAQPASAIFFGPRNADDPATQLSADRFLAPLAELVAEDHPGWAVDTMLGEQATKERLCQTIQGRDSPAFLMTASHGVCLREENPRRRALQGALVCQDWPGPLAWNQALPTEHYFSSADLGPESPLPAGIALHFACYSAGTPDTSDFQRTRPAPHLPTGQPFLAGLPTAMLGHPRGGPLAVVGHVERSWVCSFYDESVQQSQLKVFRQCLRRSLRGHRVGYAFEPFNLRHAALSAFLHNELDQIQQGRQGDPKVRALLWMASHDARNYLLLGDPAVRLSRSKS